MLIKVKANFSPFSADRFFGAKQRAEILAKTPKAVPLRPIKVDSKLKPVALKRVKAAT